MIERPIIMQPESVRAILDGYKTQTRRVVKLPDGPWFGGETAKQIDNGPDLAQFWSVMRERFVTVACPYGTTGDRLWVRERHCFLDVSKSSTSNFPLGPQNNNERGPTIWNVCVEYSDGTQNETSVEKVRPKQTRARGEIAWRPSIHMPRWACRLVLEVTAVRVERLQEISEGDAFAEGIVAVVKGDKDTPYDGFGGHRLPSDAWAHTPAQAYRILWDSLNAKRGFGWHVNPWVWVLEFKK